MIIKNKKELATTKLRKQALEIIEAGVERVLPINLMHSAVKYNAKQKILIVQNKKYNLGQGRVFVIGGGKAAGLMAEEIEKIIGLNNITAGVVNCKSSDYKTEKIKVVKASHPIPNQNGVSGVKKMLALKEKYNINKNDFVICLISGGASALMPYPVDGVSLKEMQKKTESLIKSGAKIQEINKVRKKMSRIKGGKLAKFFLPANIISLIISDVVGNDLKIIASGLTDFKSKKVHNHIIGDNKIALSAMKDRADQLGLKPLILTAEQVGDPAKMANIKAKEVINGKYANYDAIIIGGETTPKLCKNHGRGGRNQHFVASSILAMKKYKGDWASASIGTDGSDFLPDVAGAIVDNNTLNLAKSRGVDVKKYLKRYDSNALFKKISKSLIITGDTGTNVGDVMVYVLE